MSNLFTERVLNMTAVTPQPEDYTGEDGLLYCFTAASVTLRKKPTSRKSKPPCLGVTATRQNVTARKPSVWSVKPPNSAESTLTPWRT